MQHTQRMVIEEKEKKLGISLLVKVFWKNNLFLLFHQF